MDIVYVGTIYLCGGVVCLRRGTEILGWTFNHIIIHRSFETTVTLRTTYGWAVLLGFRGTISTRVQDGVERSN